MLALKSFCMQQEESAAEEHIDQGDDNKKERIMQGSKDADISQMLHTTTNEGKSYVPEDIAEIIKSLKRLVVNKELHNIGNPRIIICDNNLERTLIVKNLHAS